MKNKGMNLCGRKKLMPIISNSADSQSTSVELINQKTALNIELSVLLRHYTGLSSTLLALLAVFGDIGSYALACKLTILLSMTCLLAAVLSGVWCCMAIHLTREKAMGRVIERLQQRRRNAQGSVSPPSVFSFFVLFCPTMLCLGVLFLWLSAMCLLFL